LLRLAVMRFFEGVAQLAILLGMNGIAELAA